MEGLEEEEEEEPEQTGYEEETEEEDEGEDDNYSINQSETETKTETEDEDRNKTNRFEPVIVFRLDVCVGVIMWLCELIFNFNFNKVVPEGKKSPHRAQTHRVLVTSADVVHVLPYVQG